MHIYDPVSQTKLQRPARPRAGARASVNKRAVLLLPRSGRPHPVLLRNISVTGACVETDVPLVVGDDVTLRVDKDLDDKLLLTAIVVGVRPKREGYSTEYGMRFIDVGRADAATLASFVERFPKRA